MNKTPFLIKTEEEAQKAAEVIRSDKICPIFAVSNVTGQGVKSLITFLSKLKPAIKQQKNVKSIQSLNNAKYEA